MKNTYALPTSLLLILFSFSSFGQLADCKGKFLGNIMPSSWGNPVIRADFAQYWNQVTPENAGKWGVAESNQNNFNWDDLDEMYNFCEQNGYPFKQHVFVWGNQQPSWISGLSHTAQRAELEDWYSQFASRYPNTAIIDVVNESLPGHAGNIEFKDAIGGDNNGASIPYLAQHPEYGPYGTGWDYIIYSFAKARDYFPNATLLLNDYNIINKPNDITAHLDIVNILKARGLIDGVGIQAHAFSVDNMSAQDITTNLNQLATAGLPIHVTELDIRGDNGNETQQRDRYATIFPAFWEHPDVAGITLWGYVEGTTWLDHTGILNANGSKRLAFTWLENYMASQPDVCNATTIQLTSPGQGATAVVNTSLPLFATVSNESNVTDVKFYANGQQVSATVSSSPYNGTFTPTVSGIYKVIAVASLTSGGDVTSDTITFTINEEQGPFLGTPHVIPGLIEAEDFDIGGNGFAYLDNTPGNEAPDTYRLGEDVDIATCNDIGGGYSLGWASAGEWLEFTVDVQGAGKYDIDFRFACALDDRTVFLEMDGQNITGDVNVPNTGDWNTWTTVTLSDIDLQAGQQILRLTIGDKSNVNVNFIEFKGVISSTTDETSIKANVYPNPSASGFTLDLASDCHYEIFNLVGHRMENGNASSGQAVGKELPLGSYLLILHSEEQKLHLPIIKN